MQKTIEYADLYKKLTNIGKAVCEFHTDKSYTLSIYCHRPQDHYLGLIMINILTLWKRSAIIVKSPEEADVSVSLFMSNEDAATILGRNPTILFSSIINTRNDPTGVEYNLPWDRSLEEYGGT